ncbi:hypothetical protein KYK31_06710 [Hymenobacter norwichensis]|nr:hypothetical protein [Hymenobacter norwichensis]
MKPLLLSFSLLFFYFGALAQVTVVVNPDGTHSTVHQGAGTAVIVNSDGTHSTVHNAQSATPVVVNSNGTHTVIHRHNDTAVQINPDGTHTVHIRSLNDSTRTGFPFWLWRKPKK